MRRFLIATTTLIALLGMGIHAQKTQRLPDWDTISVREQRFDNSQEQIVIRMQFTPDGFTVNGGTLEMLASYAYDVRSDQIANLPDWAKDVHFHIEAKVAPEDVPKLRTLTDKAKQELLQLLLAQRFGLKVHNENREGKIF